MKLLSRSVFYLKTLILLLKKVRQPLRIFVRLLRKLPVGELTLKNGTTFAASTSNNLFEIIKEVWFEHRYNPPDLKIEKTGVIVDIGANVGVFSIYARQLTSGKILTVEPFAENCLRLRRNLKRNRIKNVILEQAAISKQTGKRHLFAQTSDSGHSFYLADKSTGSLLVKTYAFTDLLKKHVIKNIALLKVDCEGEEGELFSSLTDSTLSVISNIALEFHDNCSTLSHQQLEKLLVKAGFTVRLAWDGSSPFGYLYATRST